MLISDNTDYILFLVKMYEPWVVQKWYPLSSQRPLGSHTTNLYSLFIDWSLQGVWQALASKKAKHKIKIKFWMYKNYLPGL